MFVLLSPQGHRGFSHAVPGGAGVQAEVKDVPGPRVRPEEVVMAVGQLPL